MSPGRKKSPPKRSADRDALPFFCDYSCRHAGFAPKGTVGDCRKELAVYCTLLDRFTVKNGPCRARRKT
ncbi:MAG TPA: hypothetical protein VMW43_08580 [Bacteroidota bacterium]|nr:hypothetical protein [Bacteroidota bacterium]